MGARAEETRRRLSGSCEASSIMYPLSNRRHRDSRRIHFVVYVCDLFCFFRSSTTAIHTHSRSFIGSFRSFCFFSSVALSHTFFFFFLFLLYVRRTNIDVRLSVPLKETEAKSYRPRAHTYTRIQCS